MIKAVVTGHSRGLGAAITNALLARAIAVLGLARRPHPDLAAAYPQTLREVAIDLADAAALAHWLDSGALRAWLADAGTVLLINNAGTIGPVGALSVQDTAGIARAVALNVGAPMVLAAAVAAGVPAPIERRIVHLSSGAARRAIAGWSIYCATKAALDHHARTVAEEAVPGLRICSLAPGVIDTDMQAEVRSSAPENFPLHAQFVEMKRSGALVSPADCARRLVDYLLAANFGREPVADLREVG